MLQTWLDFLLSHRIGVVFSLGAANIQAPRKTQYVHLLLIKQLKAKRERKKDYPSCYYVNSNVRGFNYNDFNSLLLLI